MTKSPPRRLPRGKLDIPADLTSQFVDKINALWPSVKTDYLKAQMMSKFISAKTDPADVRRARAIFKWLCAEMENESTNERLLMTDPDYQILPGVKFSSFVDWCRDFVSDTIGDTVPVDALLGAFSGGASTSRSRTSSQPARKYVGKAHVTESALPIFLDIIEEMEGWLVDWNLSDAWWPTGLSGYEIVPGNVLFTVPKKTDIDRVAAKEPDLNMFIQRGLGKHLGACLKRIGINLHDQSKNRSLAHRGSVTNELSTLDLSSASDSVTEGLVALLLPETWFTFLDAVRCRVTIIDGEEHRNQMFSSMGNGFTFELESLLFLTIARAVSYFRGEPGVVSVYGDDIICPRATSHYLTSVLRYFGFQVNPDKSFYEGPFRESCGGHYHSGVDITPFYIEEPVTTLTGVIHLANQLRKWAQMGDCSVLDPEVEEIWLWLKGFVPQCLWGGDNLSFKYQLVSLDPSHSRLMEQSKRKESGIGGYYHWLNAARSRNQVKEAIETSSFSVSLSTLRVRKVRESTVPRLNHVFYHEIHGDVPLPVVV